MNNLESSQYAPVIVFAFNRPNHLAATITALLRCPESKETNIVFCCDGPRNEMDQVDIRAVREFIDHVQGFKTKNIIVSDLNKGLAKSIIDGVTEVIEKFGRVIVLEDDMVVSPHFLGYMNSSLNRFETNEKVASIHGYQYPLRENSLKSPFFVRGADCWGWATWKRAWDKLVLDPHRLLNELKERNLLWEFDYFGTYPYSKMLNDRIHGRNNSWAILWYASTFLREMITLYPHQSLVLNIGNDGSGTHCGSDDDLAGESLRGEPQINNILEFEHSDGKIAMAKFFFGRLPLWRKLFCIVTLLLKSKTYKSLAKKYLPDSFLYKIKGSRGGIIWKTTCLSFNEVIRKYSGYDDESILDKVKAITLEVRSGKYAYERDGVGFFAEHINPNIKAFFYV